MRPTQGRIRVRGRVGALIEVGAGFHPMLTGRENIYVNGAILGMGKAEIDRKFDQIVEFADIGDFLDSPVKFYSSGMYVRLGFAIAAHLEPDILLIDEVLAVGDAGFQSKCLNAIGQLRRNGCTMLFISHNMHSVIRTVTQVLFLKAGQPRALGPMEAVMETYRDEYMGSLAAVSEGIQEKTATGTGAAVIERVVFINADGQETHEVTSGQPVSMRLHYRRIAPLVRNPTLDLCICDRFGHIFFQTTSRIQGVQLGDLNTIGVLEAHIASLCAAPQVLTFYLAMWNNDQTELLDWRREIPLRVSGSSLSQGQVHLETRWENRGADSFRKLC
jgi:lipopolysaccharide transport system ATP-binding protein